MAKKDLTGKKVAILVDEGFEQVELVKPRKALDRVGAATTVVSPQDGQVRGWNLKKWGKYVTVDVQLNSADPTSYDALLLPGGVMNPDRLRTDQSAVQFVRSFFEAGKPVAAICHAAWMLVEADVVRGRTVTSWPSIRTDIQNAGGDWVDREVVIDEGLVTSRNPDDIPSFNRKMIEEFAAGRHEGQRASVLRYRQEGRPEVR